jgi:hypothetical protein
MIYDRAPTKLQRFAMSSTQNRGTFTRAINPSWHKIQSASKVASKFPNRKLQFECKFQRKPESSRATTPQSYQTSRSAELWTPKPWISTTQWNFTQNESQSSTSIEFQFHCLTKFLSPSTRLDPFPRSRAALYRFHVQLITLLVQKLQNHFKSQRNEDDSAVIYRS